MASKISALTDLAAFPATDDWVIVVDKSDTTMAASGTDKKVSIANFFGANLLAIAGLADPNADKIIFWDDSAGTYVLLACGSYIAITGTTIDPIRAIPDITTTAEVLAGAVGTRYVAPDTLYALWKKGADVASAGTTALGDGAYFHVTGTTTITDIDWTDATDGRVANVIFDGILTLTHHATTLKLPGGANITTAAGDRAAFVQDSGDNVICLWYQRADDSIVTVAAQSDQETGTSTTLPVTPGRQHFHPSAIKCWANISGASTTPNGSYNVTSVSNDVGETVVTIATDFSGTGYSATVSCERANSTTTVTNAKSVVIKSGSQAVGSITIQCWDATATNNVIEDPTSFHIQMAGDQ